MISRQTYFYFPLSAFLLSWIFIFTLFQLSPIQLYEVEPSTLFILLASIILIVLGFVFYRLFFMDSNWLIERQIHKSMFIEINYHKLSVFILGLSLIVAVAVVINTYLIASERGGFVKYITNPILSRKLVSDLASGKDWKLIYSLSGYGVSMNFIGNILGGLLFASEKKRHKLLSLIPVFIGIVIGLLNFSRYTLVYSILLWLFSILLVTYFLEEERQKSTLKQLLFISIGFVVTFFFISYLIITLRFFTSSESEIRETYFLQLNYYLIGNVIALDRFFEQDLAFHWGGSLFRSILKWLARLGLWDEGAVMEANYSFVKIDHNLVMNTYTYIRVLWEDFGLAGLLPGSFIWGFFSAYTMKRFLDKFSLIRLYFGVIIIIALFLSFFGFFFVAISKIIFEAAIVIVFSRMLNNQNVVVIKT